ncbi:glycosyltransferase family 4 protein [Cellulomonas sp. URHB0016]
MTHVVVAHPSPDLYGSDRQLLESISAIVGRGGTVELVLPADGPLLPLARDRGAQVLVASFPVLRKRLLHPLRLPGLLWRSATATVRATRWLRRVRPDLLYVNTVTIPVWLLAGRLARVPVLAHVHEAEDGGRLVAAALAAPMLLARRVVANSAAAAAILVAALPPLAARTEVVHNGVPAPPSPPADAGHATGAPWRLAAVGRLSPRKGTDVALEAVALLAAQGLDVQLSVAGTAFAGYEWFVEQLTERASRPDLAGRVELLGYVHPTWDLLAASDVVLVPSRVEPFGNTAVEAMLARRPVVASRTQGLAEVVLDGRTGLLVAPDDPVALAAAVAGLLRDDAARDTLARAGEVDAHDRFSTEKYSERLLRVIDEVTG